MKLDPKTEQALNDLSKFASNAPDAIKAAEAKVNDVAGGTKVGDALNAGLKGAAAGLASGAGVGTGVATAAVAVGALTATAAAAQAIPVIGTIAGAVIGIVAGLVAFFTGKHKVDEKAVAALMAEWNELAKRISTAVGLLPEPLKSKAVALLEETLKAVPYGGSPAKYAGAIFAAVRGFPEKLQGAVVAWAAEQADIERAEAAKKAAARASAVKVVGILAVVGVIAFVAVKAVKPRGTEEAEVRRSKR